MKTPPQPRLSSFADLLGDVSGRFLFGAKARVALGSLARGTSLGGRLAKLSGKSVLLATREQLAAALALIELDGVASRIIICPPDIGVDQFPSVMARGAVDAIVCDGELPDLPNGVMKVLAGGVTEVDAVHREQRDTEWVLLTSGTTGTPKMIAHTLASLTSPIQTNPNTTAGLVWGTFYDIRRYGGLQIFLRGVLGRGSLVLSCADEAVGEHLARLGGHGVTHLSGTPSHWRRALMSPRIGQVMPGYVRLSGEISDQAILNALSAAFPNARVSHAFASTEAGVAFEVDDGLAGFPAGFLGKRGDVEMKVEDGSLLIRSNRCASGYLGSDVPPLAGADGFVDTGDIVELREGRYYFLGRRNGVINVGGLKIHPEEVEAVINRHPAVRMSMVRSRKNAIMGALVAADVVLRNPALETAELDGFKAEIMDICRENLAAQKVPAVIRWVTGLEVTAAGKLVRPNA